MLQYVVGALQKLAATQDLAIVILTQCATKMQAERGATLIPSVNATAWDQGISTRLVLFRDWAPDGAELRAPHFVGVQKKNGKGNSGSLDDVTAFSIKPVGFRSPRHLFLMKLMSYDRGAWFQWITAARKHPERCRQHQRQSASLPIPVLRSPIVMTRITGGRTKSLYCPLCRHSGKGARIFSSSRGLTVTKTRHCMKAKNPRSSL